MNFDMELGKAVKLNVFSSKVIQIGKSAPETYLAL